MSYYDIIDYKMNLLDVKTAMFFPQFKQMYIPYKTNGISALMHEKMHEEYFNNTYGLIIKDLFEIIQNLKDHIIGGLEDYIYNILNIDINIEDDVLNHIDMLEQAKNKTSDFSMMSLIIKVDQKLSQDDNIVDIFAFFNEMYEKYSILINSSRVTHEGVATYLTLISNDISFEEKKEIKKKLGKNEFYKKAYLKIYVLNERWGIYFKDILDIIFKVPLYNYDLIGMSLEEFREITKFVYNPDKRLEFMINCSIEEKMHIIHILKNKKEIVNGFRKKTNNQDIRHKFPTELIEESYMLEIHKVMGISTPDYRRPFEHVYNIMEVVPDNYTSLNYILLEHSRMHRQVEDIFRRLNCGGRPVHYSYRPSLCRDYFFYSRAKEGRIFTDKLISAIVTEEHGEELGNIISLNNINELVDV